MVSATQAEITRKQPPSYCVLIGSRGPSSSGYCWRNRRFCVDLLLRVQPSGAVAMSLRPAEIAPVPAATAQVAAAAFPKGCPAMRRRDALGAIYDDRMFASL